MLHRDDFSERLLPAGRLREPFSSLARAQIIAMRCEDEELEPELRRRGYAGPCGGWRQGLKFRDW